MTAVTLVGWIASAVGMTVGLPQLIKLIRTRNVDGLSLFAWQATLVANLIWLGHGIRIEQLPHVVTNLAGLATTLPLVLLLARSHRLGRFAALWPPLAAAAVVIGIDLAWGTAAFGVAAIVPMLCAIAGQSVELGRSRPRGVGGVHPRRLRQPVPVAGVRLPDRGRRLDHRHLDRVGDHRLQPGLVLPAPARAAGLLRPIGRLSRRCPVECRGWRAGPRGTGSRPAAPRPGRGRPATRAGRAAPGRAPGGAGARSRRTWSGRRSAPR